MTLRDKQKAATEFIVGTMFDWWDNGHGDGFAAWIEPSEDLAHRLEKIYGKLCQDECGALPSEAQFRVIERACKSDYELRASLSAKGLDEDIALEQRTENMRQQLWRYL